MTFPDPEKIQANRETAPGLRALLAEREREVAELEKELSEAQALIVHLNAEADWCHNKTHKSFEKQLEELKAEIERLKKLKSEHQGISLEDLYYKDLKVERKISEQSSLLHELAYALLKTPCYCNPIAKFEIDKICNRCEVLTKYQSWKDYSITDRGQSVEEKWKEPQK